LIIGSSFPYIEFLSKPGQALGIQIDHRPERIGLRYPVDIGLYLPRNEDRTVFKAGAKGTCKRGGN